MLKWSLRILVGLVLLVVVGLPLYAKFGAHLRNLELERRVAPVCKAVAEKREPPSAEVLRLATSPATRIAVYQCLRKHGKAPLFPQAFLSQQAFAESQLVTWLIHPNELATEPAAIELAATLRAEDFGMNKGKLFVFRFRAPVSSVFADEGWMGGIAGPYPDDGALEPEPLEVFSMVDSIDTSSPATIAQHVTETVASMGGAFVSKTESANQ